MRTRNIHCPTNTANVRHLKMNTAEIIAFPVDENKPVTGKSGTKSKKTETKYLTENQIDRLREQAKKGRNGLRDETMLLVQYRHGYRSAEMVYSDKAKGRSGLTWDDIDFKQGTIKVRRLKDSVDSVHFLQGDELTRLKKLQKVSNSPYVFSNANGLPVQRDAYRKMVARLGKKAGFIEPIGTHQIRHGTGYYLVNKGTDTRLIQAYLGHVDIGNTVRYTVLDANRFKGVWDR